MAKPSSDMTIVGEIKDTRMQAPLPHIAAESPCVARNEGSEELCLKAPRMKNCVEGFKYSSVGGGRKHPSLLISSSGDLSSCGCQEVNLNIIKGIPLYNRLKPNQAVRCWWWAQTLISSNGNLSCGRQ